MFVSIYMYHYVSKYICYAFISQEVEIILEQVVSSNAVYQSLYSKYVAFEAWRQVTEVLVTACTPDLLDKESQHTLLFELLQDLLIKVKTLSVLCSLLLYLMDDLYYCTHRLVFGTASSPRNYARTLGV